jgi:transposase InsO family protein
MADTFIMAWQLPGRHPCRGERCRSWSNGGNSSDLQNRRRRPVGNFAEGSGSAHRPATNGCDAGVRAIASCWTARVGRSRHRCAAPASWKPWCSRFARLIQPGARARFSGAWSDRWITPPAASTIHAILSRHGRIDHQAAAVARTYCRFEREAPNHLWQMDFKGWIALSSGARCHPLTIVDDHSRYVPCLQACSDQQTETVQAHLRTTFRQHGLPDAMFVDNGSPWGDSGAPDGPGLRCGCSSSASI